MRSGLPSLRRHTCLVFKPLPNIPQQMLNSVVYVYPDLTSARVGERAGGTGFLTGVRTVDPNLHYVYVATNSHVVGQGEGRVLRFNTVDGGTDFLPIPDESWIHHPDGDDVAVAPINAAKHHAVHCIPEETFITRTLIEDEFKPGEQGFGPGDEVFFIGRFMTHEGKQKNLPTVRFGNLSMLPWEPLVDPKRGVKQESFLVEARSLPGYSGSPVFIFRWSYIDANGSIQYKVSSAIRFLGLDWCHLRAFNSVLEKDRESPVQEGWLVEQNSGMMGVVPAWKLSEVLHVAELEDARSRADGRLAAEARADGSVSADSASDFKEYEDLAQTVISAPKEQHRTPTD